MVRTSWCSSVYHGLCNVRAWTPSKRLGFKRSAVSCREYFIRSPKAALAWRFHTMYMILVYKHTKHMVGVYGKVLSKVLGKVLSWCATIYKENTLSYILVGYSIGYRVCLQHWVKKQGIECIQQDEKFCLIQFFLLQVVVVVKYLLKISQVLFLPNK